MHARKQEGRGSLCFKDDLHVRFLLYNIYCISATLLKDTTKPVTHGSIFVDQQMLNSVSRHVEC